ncbi:unnamed protein product [Rhizopus stolonifer]
MITNTDFSKLLPRLRAEEFTYDDENDEDLSNDEEPHFSLITGQYKSTPFSRMRDTKEEGSREEITSKLTDLTLRREYLKNRTYRGLEANVGQDEAAEIHKGLSGIARGYKK